MTALLSLFTGVPFPKNFLQICKKILCRLFRVFVHVYIHHFDRIILMGAEAHVNTCYKHFYYFVTELNLIDRKELEPLVSVESGQKLQEIFFLPFPSLSYPCCSEFPLGTRSVVQHRWFKGMNSASLHRPISSCCSICEILSKLCRKRKVQCILYGKIQGGKSWHLKIEVHLSSASSCRIYLVYHFILSVFIGQ